MTTNFYFNNNIANTRQNSFNTANPLYYYQMENNQDNFGVTQSKFSNTTFRTPKAQYLNPYVVEGNNIGLKTSPNVVPMTNAFNIGDERKNNHFFNPNNYQQRLSNIKNVRNITFSAEKIPRYSTKTNNISLPNFSPFSLDFSPKITIPRAVSPKIENQNPNSTNPNIPRPLANAQNNIINPTIVNNNQNTPKITNNIQIINETKLENEEPKINNNNEDNDNTKKTQEINNAVLTTNIQISNNPRINNPQLASSAHLPSKSLTLNNAPILNNLQSDNNSQVINNNNNNNNNNLRYSFPQKMNTEFNSENLQKKENLAFNTPKKGLLKINGEIINDNTLKEFYREIKGGIVGSYAYFEEENSSFREYMEDKGKSIENLKGDPNKILFCLFDGHGGGEVSSYLQDYFGQYLKQIVPFKNFIIDLRNLFKLVDEKVKLLNVPGVGSTATIAYIEKQNGKKILYCANIGDSRCVLVKKNRVIKMSFDDRVDEPSEFKRIVSQGGIIFNGRIYGQLMLSRSFGDWGIKEYGVKVEPHVVRTQVADDDLYLIIASDGVWDVIKDEELLNLANPSMNTLAICRNIVLESLNRGSQDNISCFVIGLN